MITGIEPLIGPAIAKAAGAGSARAAGWGVSAVMAERRRRKIRSLVHSKARATQLQALSELSGHELHLLTTFCDSLELENLATSITRAHLVEGSGKAADKYFTAIKQEFRATLDLWMGVSVDQLVVDAIYSSVIECVTRNVSTLYGKDKLSPSLEAELIATMASLSAASVRNTELLKGIENLSEIRAFEQGFKSQVAGLLGTMKLPHAGTTKQVPYEDLFVEPRVIIDSEDQDVRRRAVSPKPVDVLFRYTTRMVLLGDPGGGKSTLSRKFTYDIAANKFPRLSDRVPFYVELRDYASSVRGRSKRTLIEYLEEICKSPYNMPAPVNAIEYLLLNNRAVLVLDGLDELLDVSLRRDVVEAVEGFALRYPTCPMLVTSRRVGYFEAALQDVLFTSPDRSRCRGVIGA